MLLAFLGHYDAPCPACGYNLRQLTQPTCPECGLGLELSVGSSEPFKRAWAIALTLSAMIGGLGSLMLLMTIKEGFPDFSYQPEFAVVYFLSIVWVPAPILLLFLRRWFCGLAKAIQYLTIGVAIASMLAIVIMMLTTA